MKGNRIQTGVRFDMELLYKISYVAKQNKRSLNAQIEYLAEKCVEKYESENGKIDFDKNKIYNE